MNDKLAWILSEWQYSRASAHALPSLSCFWDKGQWHIQIVRVSQAASAHIVSAGTDLLLFFFLIILLRFGRLIL